MAVTSARLAAFLAPRGFALVGASERSTFARLVHDNLVAAGHGEVTYLVNPRSDRVFGRPAHPTCTSIGRPVDLAFVLRSADAVPDALRDAAAAGARGAVVLASGYAEAGADGRRRQRELVALAEELDLLVLGPNTLGFVDVAAGVPAIALADPPGRAAQTDRPGRARRVALVSHSGASCAAMKDFAQLSGIALSHLFTLGNEAMITAADLVDHLVGDDQVGAVALFLEGIRDPDRFAAAARRAAAAGKALVVLKAGRSELAARAAASHTGALAGEDRVVEAVFRRLGVIRVDSVEDMLVTAGVAAHCGPLDRYGLGVVSISGGACEVAADLAAGTGLDLPQLSAETVDRLAPVMPAFGQPRNPLDLTGAAVADPELWRRGLAAVGSDPRVGVLVAINSLPWRPAGEGEAFYGQPQVDAIGAGLAEAGVPGFYLTQVTQPIGPWARSVLDAAGVAHAVPGLRLGITAVARLAEWSRRRREVPAEPRPAMPAVRLGDGPYSEVDARRLLERAGVPVVPARHARSAEEAAHAAAAFGDRVAMKIVSAGIAHKSDVGGVRLGVPPAAAAAVYEEVVRACRSACAGVPVDGVLVSPLRPPALELLVGVLRDPVWGLVLTVGLGGTWVEVLDDLVLEPLPVSPAQVRQALARMRGAALLNGARGGRPADVDRLAEVISRIGRLAESIGDRLAALEVNPLRVSGADIEALDALLVLRGDRRHC